MPGLERCLAFRGRLIPHDALLSEANGFYLIPTFRNNDMRFGGV
jgi:hypothetical protein